MKKILFYIFNIVAILFVVCIFIIRCSATDITTDYANNPPNYVINGSDSPLKNGDFWNSVYSTDKSFANPNVYVYQPNNWGNNFGSLPSQHTKILFNKHTISEFTTSYNAENLYYTPNQLTNFEFRYISVYQVLTPTLLSSVPIEIEVNITNVLNEDQVVKGYYVPFNFSVKMADYGAKAYVNETFTNPISASYDMYVGVLVIEMPFQKQFTDNLSRYLINGFYVDNINVGTYPLDITASKRYMCYTHVFDVFVLNKGLSVPPKVNILHTSVNNIGYVNGKFLNDTTRYNYFTFLNASLGNEKLTAYSKSSNYNFTLDSYAVMNLDVYVDTANYNLNYYALCCEDYLLDIGNIQLCIEKFIQNKYLEGATLLADMPTNLRYFRTGLTNNTYNSTNILSTFPYYSSFCLYATMPSSSNSSGNSAVDFNSDYAQQYYIEPTSWKDFGAHFSNALVWLAFECPILNNLTGPLYLFLNSFANVWTNLLFPLITALGVFGSALICFYIYKFISMLLTSKSD